MKFLLSFSFLVLFSSFLQAREVPRGGKAVVDEAGLLSRQTTKALSNALYQVKKQTGNEIAVLTVKSLEDETIDGYSIKVADQWKLGTKGKDNGVLFLIAVDEKKMRIEVGRGLEGDLPDVMAGRIIQQIKPYFKKGDYKSGIIVGVSHIVEKTGGKLTNAPRVRNRRSRKGFSGLIFIIFIIIAMGSGRGGRGLLLGMFLGSMSGGRGGGSFGSSGGGFGGGGGFSGGGASGDW